MKYFQIAEVTLLIVSSSYKALAFTTLSNKIRAPLQSLSSLSAVDDKTEVREYFNTEGFNRWNKIYSDSDEVNTVQMDIRTGHDQTISKILKWVESDGDMEGKTVCDCGCGVGSLAIPLAKMGCKISASDISASMVNEAARRSRELGISEEQANFYTSDLQSVTGYYDTVTCVDVAIHYPSEKMTEMVQNLCDLSERRVLISFAPKTWYYQALKKFGELFPGPSKTTRAYLHEEEIVRNAFKKAGFEITREEMTGTNFYFSRLLEAKKKIA